MRGALGQVQPGDGWPRIIPADAGSTVPDCAKRSMARDHPRGCGEHWYGSSITSKVTGSSPRMRGAQRHKDQSQDRNRIIPADAGSTWRWWCCTPAERDHPRGCGEHPPLNTMMGRQVRDHPRGCGEHVRSPTGTDYKAGSSPRMRGAPTSQSLGPTRKRIIPADAGST